MTRDKHLLTTIFVFLAISCLGIAIMISDVAYKIVDKPVERYYYNNMCNLEAK